MSINIVKGFSKFRCIRWLNKIRKAVNYYRPHIWNIPQFCFKTKKNQLLCWWMRAREILGLLIILILKTIQVIRGSAGTDKSALFHSYRFTDRFCCPLGLRIYKNGYCARTGQWETSRPQRSCLNGPFLPVSTMLKGEMNECPQIPSRKIQILRPERNTPLPIRPPRASLVVVF